MLARRAEKKLVAPRYLTQIHIVSPPESPTCCIAFRSPPLPLPR